MRNKQGYPKTVVPKIMYEMVEKAKGKDWAEDNLIINEPVPQDTRVFVPCPNCKYDISKCEETHQCCHY